MTTGKTEAVVYYPPKAGCPFLAVIISDGRVLACEPVKSLSEGEMVSRARPATPTASSTSRTTSSSAPTAASTWPTDTMRRA
jgi:hypothetical protein